ncbi:MAG: hypothetical protein Q9182_006332 [Xanthomendoza sp. 2 TL-2023]
MAPATKSSKKRRSSADSNNNNDDYQSDNGFVADAPKPKKLKPSSHPAANPTPAPNRSNAAEAEYWELTPTRRITLDEFRGSTMINIREYYPDKTTGAMLPGKKGISLPLPQYSTLLTLLPNIEAALAAKGESVPRPQYPGVNTSEDDPPDAGAEDEDDEAHGGDGKKKKKNFEATSEEDG